VGCPAQRGGIKAAATAARTPLAWAWPLCLQRGHRGGRALLGRHSR
jgi:hypothetical protein